MQTNLSLRALGLLAVPAALLLAFLTPVQAVAFDDHVKPWLRDLDTVHALADRVWSSLGGSLDRYDFWGRWTVACYLGMIAGVRSFVHVVADVTLGSRVLLTALWVAAVGDLGAYWAGGVVSQIFGTVEFLALPVVIGAVARYAYVQVRRGPRPRWVGWVLLASVAAVPVCMAATNYWPHGALLPISVGIAALGVVAAVRPRTGEPELTGV